MSKSKGLLKTGGRKTGSLTQRQETFCLAYIETGNASEAYRRAYNTENMKSETVHRNAKALMDNNKIATRIEEIRAPVIQKARYELEDAMREAEQARKLALADPKGAGAAVSATALKAKLNGLLVEDRQNKRRPLEDMDDAELDALIRRSSTDAGVTIQ